MSNGECYPNALYQNEHRAANTWRFACRVRTHEHKRQQGAYQYKQQATTTPNYSGVFLLHHHDDSHGITLYKSQ
jgi:hypothetical protein